MREIISHPTVLAVLMIIYLIVCLLGEIAALVFLTHASWDARVGVPLQIVAFYGIGLGLMARSKTIKEVLGVSEDMTSHNSYRFVRGNALFLSLLFSVVGTGLSPDRKEGSSLALGCLGNALMLAVTPLVLLYSVFHVVAIMPITYLGYVVASALVESVQYSAVDQEYSVSSDEMANNKKKLRVRELVAADPVAAKSFVIGIPAAILTFVTKLVVLFLNT